MVKPREARGKKAKAREHAPRIEGSVELKIDVPGNDQRAVALELPPDLTKRWARAKLAEDRAREDVEDLRSELLRCGVKIGFEDQFLVVGRSAFLEGQSQVLIIESRSLESVLRREGCFEEVLERRVSLVRVRAIAKLNPQVAKALTTIQKEAAVFKKGPGCEALPLEPPPIKPTTPTTPSR